MNTNTKSWFCDFEAETVAENKLSIIRDYNVQHKVNNVHVWET